jgi:hypothetical protein
MTLHIVNLCSRGILKDRVVMATDLDVELPLKDQPILGGAIAGNATHLLTGDERDFGKLLGETIQGVRIVSPGCWQRNCGWSEILPLFFHRFDLCPPGSLGGSDSRATRSAHHATFSLRNGTPIHTAQQTS